MTMQFGHYNVVAELGRGGMGVVYKAHETSLNRYVAIKVLASSLTHDLDIKERFVREARAMAVLNDPHIIQIYFIGEENDETYFVMEYVDGESLGSVLKRQVKLKPAQAAKIIYQIAQGLFTAHEKGLIHRDIKPANLMLTRRGSVKIADFGIALTMQDVSKKLTSTGEFVGTPGYLSPEVCLGKPVDQRSDIFSLGIVLFEMLAGRMPFTDDSPLGLMLEVVKAEIPDVCTLNAEVDAELSRILSRMIAKDPAARYQNCQELVDDLAKHPMVTSGTLNLPLQSVLKPAISKPALGAATLATAGGAAAAIAARNSSTVRRNPVPRLMADAPMVGRDPAPIAQRSPHTRYWLAGAAVAVVAASAWAYQSDLPLIQTLSSTGRGLFGAVADSPSDQASSMATISSATSEPSATAATAIAPQSGAQNSQPSAQNALVQSAPDSAQSNSDAYAAAADPATSAERSDSSSEFSDSPYFSGADATDGSDPEYGYAETSYAVPTYPYPPTRLLIGAAPVTYYPAPLPSVGFGIGWGFAARPMFAYPAPLVYAPPAFAAAARTSVVAASNARLQQGTNIDAGNRPAIAANSSPMTAAGSRAFASNSPRPIADFAASRSMNTSQSGNGFATQRFATNTAATTAIGARANPPNGLPLAPNVATARSEQSTATSPQRNFSAANTNRQTVLGKSGAGSTKRADRIAAEGAIATNAQRDEAARAKLAQPHQRVIKHPEGKRNGEK